MCAEGGTGYYHSVTMGRSENVWGPYEAGPCNLIVTSVPENHNERADWDHGSLAIIIRRVSFRNPVMPVMWIFRTEKPGWYISLPDLFVPELRALLAVKTAIQRMKWTRGRLASNGKWREIWPRSL